MAEYLHSRRRISGDEAAALVAQIIEELGLEREQAALSIQRRLVEKLSAAEPDVRLLRIQVTAYSLED
jgi:hypothetical protein